MIRLNELVPVATVNKIHGIRGELSVTVDTDVVLEPDACLITPIDGIPVPFFITSIRPRSVDSFLVKLEGVDDDERAASFSGATFYANPDLVKIESKEVEEDGIYASMLIGLILKDIDGSIIGKITDIDDSTQNLLLIVDRPDKTTVLIPLADDLITDINPEEDSLIMDIPSGLLDLQ